eukprot:4628788-Pleurochrysis_carterae.AAC.1
MSLCESARALDHSSCVPACTLACGVHTCACGDGHDQRVHVVTITLACMRGRKRALPCSCVHARVRNTADVSDECATCLQRVHTLTPHADAQTGAAKKQGVER